MYLPVCVYNCVAEKKKINSLTFHFFFYQTSPSRLSAGPTGYCPELKAGGSSASCRQLGGDTASGWLPACPRLAQEGFSSPPASQVKSAPEGRSWLENLAGHPGKGEAGRQGNRGCPCLQTSTLSQAQCSLQWGPQGLLPSSLKCFHLL